MYHMTELCKKLDQLYYQIFQTHQRALNLTHPEFGFLFEDCYTPYGEEECLGFLAHTLDDVHFVIGKLQAIQVKEMFQYVNKVQLIQNEIKSILQNIRENAAVIYDLKEHLSEMVKLNPPFASIFQRTKRKFPYYLSFFIDTYGIFDSDDSLSEGKLFFVEKEACEQKGCNQITFHRELKAFIKLHYTAKILQNIPERANEAFFKEKIKECSNLPRKGINNEAIFKFLRCYIFNYRWGLNVQPLGTLIRCLEASPFKFLHENLRDEASKSGNEMWNSGNHEWLPCRQINDVIKRSAGQFNNVKPFVVAIGPTNNSCIVIDWLAIHAELRSEVKRLYFINKRNSIESGHVPAVRNSLKVLIGTTGTTTEGSDVFHNDLNKAFNISTNPREFVRRAHLIATDHIQSGKKRIAPSRGCFFTIEGKKTDDETSMSELRHNQILPAYRQRKQKMRLFSNLTISGIDGNNVGSPPTTETEYTSYTDDSNSESIQIRRR